MGQLIICTAAGCISAGAIAVSFRMMQRQRFCIAAVFAALFAAVVLYRKFLTGEIPILYTVVDGFSQYLPKYVNYIRDLSEGGGLSFWTFSIGFGALQKYDSLLYPLNFLPTLAGTLWGETALMIGFAWMQVLKIGLSALFAFLFLRQMKFSPAVCCCMALLYAFNGIMILRGNWIYLADECYLIMMILWSAELLFREGKWHWLPVSVFLLSSAMKNTYYLYLYAILLIAYATVRYGYEHGSLRRYVPFLLRCGACALLGVMAWGAILLGFSWSTFATARFSDTQSNLGLSSLLALVDGNVIISAGMSLFEPSSMGSFDQYSGALNYLERPMFYCGIFCLFLIPQGMRLGEKRQRRLIGGGLAAAAAYLLFPIVTDVLNAFIRNEELGQRSYRLSSLWVVVVMIVMAAYGLECAVRHGRFDWKTVMETGLVLTIVFFAFCLVSSETGYTVYYAAARWSAVFLCIWVAVLSRIRLKPRKALYRWASMLLLIVLSAAEVIHAGNTVVSHSGQYALEQYARMQESKLGYYGSVNDAVEYLKEKDKGLYRVSGVRPEVGSSTYCSPIYFGIFDSSYYTNIGAGTYAFMNEVYPEAFTGPVGSKYSVGVGEDLLLSTLTGYKYMITEADASGRYPEGYELLETFGDVAVLENQYALSFGVAYESGITRSLFCQYSDEEQRLLLMRYAVLEDGEETKLRLADAEEADAFLQTCAAGQDSYETLAKQKQKDILHIDDWTENYICGTITVQEDRLLMLSVPNVSGWRLYVDGEQTEIKAADIAFMGAELTEGTHSVELRYRPALLTLGTAISAASILLFAALLLFRKKLRLGDFRIESFRKPSAPEEQAEAPQEPS